MVRGLDIFRQYFKDYAGNYIIIGGTACSELIEDEGLKPRATKDIDLGTAGLSKELGLEKEITFEEFVTQLKNTFSL